MRWLQLPIGIHEHLQNQVDGLEEQGVALGDVAGHGVDRVCVGQRNSDSVAIIEGHDHGILLALVLWILDVSQVIIDGSHDRAFVARHGE